MAVSLLERGSHRFYIVIVSNRGLSKQFRYEPVILSMYRIQGGCEICPKCKSVITGASTVSVDEDGPQTNVGSDVEHTASQTKKVRNFVSILQIDLLA